jgi:hypothetical protein
METKVNRVEFVVSSLPVLGIVSSPPVTRVDQRQRSVVYAPGQIKEVVLELA